jgi:hypothetical protein
MGAPATAVLLGLSCVLASAAVLKVRSTSRPRPFVVELCVAALVVVAPARLAAGVLSVVFVGFTVAHVRSWRAGREGCDCFGDASAGRGVSAIRAGSLTAVAAVGAVAVGIVGAPTVLGLLASDPGAVPAVVLAAVVGAAIWCLAFTVRAGQADRAASALARGSALFFERRLTRRMALQQVALVGSALAVAPLRYLLYPGTAMAAIGPWDCGGGLCTDGYTAFCCEINNGLNSCPEGSFPGGWWMCTDYAGRLLCAEQGVRYYVDCNAVPGGGFPGGCACAGGNCKNRRVACNVFRYGQCNPQVPGVTAVVCRMVMCENPSTVPALNCSSSLAVDDAVCGHEAPCLGDAVQLAGAGGA